MNVNDGHVGFKWLFQVVSSTAPANEELRSTKKPALENSLEARTQTRASSTSPSPTPSPTQKEAAETTPSPPRSGDKSKNRPKSVEVVDEPVVAPEKLFENEILSEHEDKLSNKVGTFNVNGSFTWSWKGAPHRSPCPVHFLNYSPSGSEHLQRHL